ncbi:MAG: fimbria major subunit [Bacteroidales bacterium]|nr:fimbria major subunit [Bacteroidales bacterium]
MKKNLLYGSMAFGLLFASCSSEDLVVDDTTNTQGDQDYYVTMRISGDMTGTRAASSGNPDEGTTGDFDPGTADENKVSTAYFVFYDQSGNVVGDVVPVDLPTPETAPSPSGTVDVYYKSTVKISVRKGESKPTQVICYLNPVVPGGLNRSLSEIQTVSRENFRNGDRNFSMSNSVYYATVPGQSAPTPQIAVVIPEAQLYSSETAAKEAADRDECVSIYVERYASKIKFEATGIEPYKSANRIFSSTGGMEEKPVELTFVPLKWTLNAVANENYVIKSFRQESTDGMILPENYSYDGLNKIINVGANASKTGLNLDITQDAQGNITSITPTGNPLASNEEWKWNNPDYHRSYWGMSPAYFTAAYPEVSSDLADMAAEGKTINQTYWSYNDVTTSEVGKNVGTTHYFKETTVGAKALASTNPAAAVGSVIYVGKYEISLNGTALEEGTGFYAYGNGQVSVDGQQVDRPFIYFENKPGSVESTVNGGGSMLQRFFVQCINIVKYDDVAGEYVPFSYTNPADMEKLANVFQIDTISKDVKQKYDGDNATILKIQANARTLQLKSNLNPSDLEGIFILSDNGYKSITSNATSGNDELTYLEANVALMRMAGLAYYYTSGHAYFNIPVKHLGWYRAGNTQKDSPSINWNLVRVGDFGVVRNHSYSIVVDKVIGLASGIGNDNTPIVPPVTPDDFYMSYRVNILKWAVVPTQNVSL